MLYLAGYGRVDGKTFGQYSALSAEPPQRTHLIVVPLHGLEPAGSRPKFSAPGAHSGHEVS